MASHSGIAKRLTPSASPARTAIAARYMGGTSCNEPNAAGSSAGGAREAIGVAEGKARTGAGPDAFAAAAAACEAPLREIIGQSASHGFRRGASESVPHSIVMRIVEPMRPAARHYALVGSSPELFLTLALVACAATAG